MYVYNYAGDIKMLVLFPITVSTTFSAFLSIFIRIPIPK